MPGQTCTAAVHAGLRQGALRGIPVCALLAWMVLLGSRLVSVQSVPEGLRLERRVHRLWCVRRACSESPMLACAIVSLLALTVVERG